MSDDESADSYEYKYEESDEDGYTDHAVDKDSSDGKDGEGKDTSMTIPTEGSYKILDATDIQSIMNSIVDDLAQQLDVEYDIALILFQEFRWLKERLVDSYFTDPDRVKEEAGILPPVGAVAPTSPADGEDVTCKICDEKVAKVHSHALSCGHYFCFECWNGWLKGAVSEGPACLKKTCPMFMGKKLCQVVVPRSIFHKMLVDEQELVDKYDNYILTQFIDTHKSMRFCPSPGCSKVAVGTGVISVQCACSNPFCFRCGEEVHEPALCDQLKDWTAKCSSESETANWILANTKKCPKCNARIEKNQGCNHMKCKNCSFDFCWTCMGPWSDHSQSTGGYYKCNRFIAPKDSSVERAKAELDRYLHFYQRYHDHNMSLKFAGNQLLGTEQRMIEMQEHGQDWSAVQYLKEATNVVINCRRVLKYTYVMGYFLEEKSEKEIAFKQLFEHHQEMLEKNTEGLSELTEKPLEELTREHVVNLTRVTANFLDSLLTAFQESERDVSAFLGSGEKSSSRK